MLLEMIIFLLLGMIAGIITGLIPGIHINLIGAGTLLAFPAFLYKIDALTTGVFLTAMAITHTFVDFIPSIYLGCPDTDTELSILPGHELLQEGKGHAAVMLANYGSISAIGIFVLLIPPAIMTLSALAQNSSKSNTLDSHPRFTNPYFP